MTKPAPLECQKLEDVYFDVETAKKRYASLISTFSKQFEGQTPQFIARSPGRVNIIGDHVDYSYFPCVPAAIEYDVVMAVQVIDDPSDPAFNKVQLVNVDPAFEPQEFPADPQVKVEGNSWVNYFKCTWITALKHLGITKPEDTRGLRVAVTGNVPLGGGLSSSAAFVVSGVMAVLRAHTSEFPLDRTGLVKLSATCEQIVGVNSGGLDQASSVFGKKDHALLVSFRPELTAEPVAFNETNDPFVFLIANSMAVSAKLETAPIHYNLRVVEVTVAAQLLAHKLGYSIPDDGNLGAGTLYGVLTEKYGGESLSPTCVVRMINDVNRCLKPEPYTLEEVAEELEMSVEDFRRKFLSAFPVRFEVLKLHQRALHVYEETLRVLSFVKAVKSNAHPQTLGDLMNASQTSAEGLYEHSHPDCENLCTIAIKNGSLGSRITGAGWGGCTVHLVERSKAEKVKAALWKDYYQVYHPEAPADALVESRPSGGSAFFSDLSQLGL